MYLFFGRLGSCPENGKKPPAQPVCARRAPRARAVGTVRGHFGNGEIVRRTATASYFFEAGVRGHFGNGEIVRGTHI